jgi:fatty acid desaturase
MLPAGCDQRRYEDFANGLAAGTVILFLVLWGMTVAISKLHDLPIFQRLRQKARLAATAMAIALVFAGLAFIHQGFFGQGLQGILLFVGSVLVIMAHHLRKWSQSDSPDDQKTNMKIVGLCLSVVATLLFLEFFGADCLRW